MKYKLICMDIDGTLLDNHKKLLPQVKQAVLNAAASGIWIVLASGRMPAGVEVIEKELGISCIKICNAGTYIIWQEICIGSVHFSIDTMKKIEKEIAQKNQIPLWIFQGKDWYVTGMDEYIKREIRIISYQPKLVKVEDLEKQWIREQKEPNKMLIAANPKRIPQIYRQIKEQNIPDIEIACSSEDFIEIFPKGVNKGTALIEICKEWKIPLEDTVAFGDQELDIPMIKAAGLGIAMGNAIKEVKESADIVTKTNQEAGIVYALEHYIMN